MAPRKQPAAQKRKTRAIAATVNADPVPEASGNIADGTETVAVPELMPDVPAAVAAPSVLPVTPVHQIMPPYKAPLFPTRGNLSPGEHFSAISSGDSDLEGETVVDASAPKARAQSRLPVLVHYSPVKQRRAAQGISCKTDLEVWGMRDEDIIDAAVRSWTSDVYKHYNITMQRNYHDEAKTIPKSIDFIFMCKTHPQNHNGPRVRTREKSGMGTTALLKDVGNCEKKQGVVQMKKTSTIIPYTYERYRALVALQCACSARPINSVQDPDYRDEVEMLRPGTIAPSPSTVQHDLISIHTHLFLHVCDFLVNTPGKMHVVLDGWTSPLIWSYLGIVLICLQMFISFFFKQKKNKRSVRIEPDLGREESEVVLESGEEESNGDEAVEEEADLDAQAEREDVGQMVHDDEVIKSAHLYFKKAVIGLTTSSGHKLRSYQLSTRQWDLADELVPVLELFDEITKLFSQTGPPLVAEVIPAMFDLQDSLCAVVDDTPPERPAGTPDDLDSDAEESSKPTPHVIRIAAYGSVMMIDKYLTLFWDCDIYIISMVMCPDKKLSFFQDRPEFDQAFVDQVKKLVINTWTSLYSKLAKSESTAPNDKGKQAEKASQNKWKVSRNQPRKLAADHIESYLTDRLVSEDALAEAGGYLGYWDKALGARPSVARMGLDYVSAPGTSHLYE
ncbi:hypothetical protein NLJ89_g11393 [Agrocybe chaxingu]|uniref:Uncharacterized protein n=1 Tax=Agrocybe chaxingu TaxID=84603 RepID=A0A9W8JWV7_9AGAR|nr:hypothetical protein NLJ89_g11393 [Agrocybe chaxingu]